MRSRGAWVRVGLFGMLLAATACSDSTVSGVGPSLLSPGPSLSVALPSYRIASFAAGANPSAGGIGDLDGDGLNDIAVANLGGGLQFFFNNGAGGFDRVSSSGPWASSAGPLDVEVGDLNGDGRNDIAVAFGTQSGAVSVLMNDGGRNFAAAVAFDACAGSRSVAIGDVDSDGDNDLATTGQCSQGTVLLNGGAGTFTLGGAYGAGAASRSITLADLNRDGLKDIAWVNQTANGTVTVLFNNGNGTFRAGWSLYAGDGPDALTTGDFDGDHTTDVAIVNSYFSQVILLFNDGASEFSGYSELSGGDIPTSIAAGDFNADGRLDIAVGSAGTNRLSILTNEGNYNFSLPFTYYLGQSPIDIAAAPLDGDALPDVLSVNQGGTISVLFSVAGSPPPPPPPPAPQISLTLSTRKTKTARFVDLKWTGATTPTVDIYRNGSHITTRSNSGSYTDQLNRRTAGTFRYKVCLATTATCSNEAAITF